MALDLFFHPRKSDFESLRTPDFAPTPAQQRARRKLIDALLARYPGCSLGGDALRGSLQGFPHGELSWFPGYLHLSVHGNPNLQVLRAVVDGLETDGLVCIDPQDAGFATGSPRRMQTFEELIGSRFVGVRLLRDWNTGLAIDCAWDDDDGRTAVIEFYHVSACAMPDPMTLVRAHIAAVDYRAGAAGTGEFDELELRFNQGGVLQLRGCVYKQGLIAARRRR